MNLKDLGFVKTAINMNKLVEMSNKVKKVRGKILITNDGIEFTAKRHSKNVLHRNRDGVALDVSPAVSTESGKLYAAGDMNRLVQKSDIFDSPPVKSGKAKNMINRTVLLHEADELKSMKRRKLTAETAPLSTFGGHASIDVIMRESNLVRSLPSPEKKEVTKFFKSFREMDHTIPGIQMVMPNFEYGKTRLSRHARKRIYNLFEKK